MKVLLLSTAIACSMLAFGQTSPYIGTYDVVRVEKGKPVDNMSISPGQVMILDLKKDGAFQMRNFLSGFDGDLFPVV